VVWLQRLLQQQAEGDELAVIQCIWCALSVASAALVVAVMIPRHINSSQLGLLAKAQDSRQSPSSWLL
jgi:hypothetical protein